MLPEITLAQVSMLVPLIIWFSTGVLKFTLSCILSKNTSLEHIGAGGFPSNHTATIVGTTMYIGLTNSFNEPVFTLGVALAAIVIFDATGLRREVGKHSQYLNKFAGVSKFREQTGHKLYEVLGGVVWGVVVAYLLS